MNPAWTARAFGWIAPVYEPVRDLFFPSIRQSYQAFETVQHSPKIALIAGAGTGDLLPFLRKVWPETQLIYLDAAPGMYQRARKIQGGLPRVSFVCASVFDYMPDEEVDAILFPFVLDCWGEDALDALREHLHRNYPALTTCYLLDFTETTSSRFSFRKWQLRLLQAAFMPVLGRLPRTLPDFSRAIPEEFQVKQTQSFWGGWIRWSMFRKETVPAPRASTE